MLLVKKIKPRTGKGNDKPIDVSWILYIGMEKLGYTEKEVYLIQLGKWLDLYETYKKVYNFETTKQLYQNQEDTKKESVMDW